jgi:hypothetical protein
MIESRRQKSAPAAIMQLVAGSTIAQRAHINHFGDENGRAAVSKHETLQKFISIHAVATTTLPMSNIWQPRNLHGKALRWRGRAARSQGPFDAQIRLTAPNAGAPRFV